MTLPGAIAPANLHVEAYTGEQGAKGHDYSASADAPSHAVFRATRALAPREGLTIVVGFPKGIVTAPTASERARWFLHDNGGVLVGGIGLLLMWAYYLFAVAARRPRSETRRDHPAIRSAAKAARPGTLRHVERMAYDDRCFAADVVDLARARPRSRSARQAGNTRLQRERRRARCAAAMPRPHCCRRPRFAHTLELEAIRALDDRRRDQAAPGRAREKRRRPLFPHQRQARDSGRDHRRRCAAARRLRAWREPDAGRRGFHAGLAQRCGRSASSRSSPA